jgi:hypothetical protein
MIGGSVDWRVSSNTPIAVNARITIKIGQRSFVIEGLRNIKMGAPARGRELPLVS